MALLPTGLLDEIQRFDPSIDLLWNGRIHRWIVVQRLPRWMPVTSGLRGCSAITGEKTQYKFLLCCEFGDHGMPAGQGCPVLPGSWIIERLSTHCRQKQQEEDEDRARGGESLDDVLTRRRSEEADRYLEHIMEEMGHELEVYGGIGEYSEDGASRVHVTIDSSKKPVITEDDL